VALSYKVFHGNQELQLFVKTLIMIAIKVCLSIQDCQGKGYS